MYIWNDKFYKDENGTIYTGEYLAHEFGSSAEEIVGKVEEIVNKYDLPAGTVVRCNYKQIFTDSDNMIMCNGIAEDVDDLELVSGEDYDEEEEVYTDIFQYFIIDINLADWLKDHTDEIIYYHNRLDIYILGVTHCGTGWDYVPADYII